MKSNVIKVLERDQKLSELDDRAEALQQGAKIFEETGTKLKQKQWWADKKMTIILCGVCLALLIIIIMFVCL